MKTKQKLYELWVSINYERNYRMLKARSIFNEDVFHDAVLAVYDALIAEENYSLSDCDRSFKEAYRRLSSKANSRNFQYAYYEDSNLFELAVTQSTDDNSEFVKRYPADTSKKIEMCIQRDLSKEDSTLFMMSVNYPNLSFEDIGKYFGIPKGTIYNKMNRIKNGIINSMNYRYGYENIL